MSNSNLPTLTQEQRQELIEKAQASKLATKEYAEANLKLDYDDDIFWTTKSAEIGVRLPNKYAHGAKGIRKTAKKLGMDIKDFLDSTGCSSLNELCELNPKWNSRALSGLIIEYYLDNYTKDNNCV